MQSIQIQKDKINKCRRALSSLSSQNVTSGHISFNSLTIATVMKVQKMRINLIFMIVLVVAVTSLAGVDAGRVLLTDNIQGSNIKTYTMSVYNKTTNSMANRNITEPGFPHINFVCTHSNYSFCYYYCSQ